MLKPTRDLALAVVAAATLLLLGACGLNGTRAPTAPLLLEQQPARAGAAGPEEAPDWSKLDFGTSPFFPLAVGNRWHYRRVGRVWSRAPDDSSLTLESEVVDSYFIKVLGIVQYWGPTYFEISMPYTITVLRDFYREDHSGLYELFADRVARRAASPVPGAAPSDAMPSLWGGGPISGEQTLLRFPLRPGISWSVYGNSSPIRQVEAEEELDLPVGRVKAYRIRERQPEDPPWRWRRLWYGRLGLVRELGHGEWDERDRHGNVVRHYVGESESALDSLRLVGYQARFVPIR